jgi:hypothetical protein
LDKKMLQKLCMKDRKIFSNKIYIPPHKRYYKMIHLLRCIIKNHHATKKLQNYSHTYHDIYKTNPYSKITQQKIIVITNINTGLIKLVLAFKKITTQTKRKKIPPYTFFNKNTLLKCGDIESNPGPRINLLVNHPQIHHERQKTYFYNKTTQIKPEYNHIFELFKPYFNHPLNINTNQQLTQFCINNNQCPQSYLFYAILIILAPTPEQSNQLIAENSTQ